MKFTTIDDWAGHWLTRQHGLLMPWLAVFMGAGVGIYFCLNFEPPVWVIGILLAVSVCVACVAGFFSQRGNVAALGFYASMCLLILLTGFALAQGRTYRVASPILRTAVDRAQVTGTVKSVELLEPGKGMRLILGRLTVEGLDPLHTPRFIRLHVRDVMPDVRVGQVVRAEAGLNPPSAPVAPHAFDFQFYAWFRQIGAFGFAYDTPQIIAQGPQSGYYAEKARQAIGSRVGMFLTGREAAMSVAMMNGQVSGVSADDWLAMRNAGLAHILAISGSHVTVLAGFVFFGVRFLLALWPHAALHWPIKKYAAAVALVTATFYVYMVGPLIPIVRAWLMTDLILIAVIVERMPISLNLLAFSSMMVMAFMPEQALGAQLSDVLRPRSPR